MSHKHSINNTPQDDSIISSLLECIVRKKETYIDLIEKVKVISTTTSARAEKQKIKNWQLESKQLWSKFGDAKCNAFVNKRLTKVSTEKVLLERPTVIDSVIKGNDEMKNEGDFLAQVGQNSGEHLNILCRICQGDHWTAHCHLNTISCYSVSTRRSSENIVRVSNFSRDANADDLRDLFITCGPLSSYFLAVDRYTGLSKGFGFVSFVNDDDAQMAIDSLHGSNYESLILHVEWSDQN